jgi:hypothetical protein
VPVLIWSYDCLNAVTVYLAAQLAVVSVDVLGDSTAASDVLSAAATPAAAACVLLQASHLGRFAPLGHNAGCSDQLDGISE